MSFPSSVEFEVAPPAAAAAAAARDETEGGSPQPSREDRIAAGVLPPIPPPM